LSSKSVILAVISIIVGGAIGAVIIGGVLEETKADKDAVERNREQDKENFKEAKERRRWCGRSG
jgi:uncharacterized membrane-anchored protein YhcB (DUF1043 family)